MREADRRPRRGSRHRGRRRRHAGAVACGACATGGRISLIGVLTGGDGAGQSRLPILMKSVRVQGIFVGSRRDVRGELNQRPGSQRSIRWWIGSSRSRRLVEAFRHMETAAHFGKIVIRGGESWPSARGPALAQDFALAGVPHENAIRKLMRPREVWGFKTDWATVLGSPLSASLFPFCPPPMKAQAAARRFPGRGTHRVLPGPTAPSPLPPGEARLVHARRPGRSAPPLAHRAAPALLRRPQGPARLDTVQYLTIFHGPRRNLHHHDVHVDLPRPGGRPLHLRTTSPANRFQLTLRDLDAGAPAGDRSRLGRAAPRACRTTSTTSVSARCRRRAASSSAGCWCAASSRRRCAWPWPPPTSTTAPTQKEEKRILAANTGATGPAARTVAARPRPQPGRLSARPPRRLPRGRRPPAAGAARPVPVGLPEPPVEPHAGPLAGAALPAGAAAARCARAWGQSLPHDLEPARAEQLADLSLPLPSARLRAGARRSAGRWWRACWPKKGCS